MKVTVRLLSGADHLSQILTGFQMLSRENKLSLDILDCRKDSPVYQEAFLEAQVNGIRILFDLMDGYWYNRPETVFPLYHSADIVFKRSFSSVKNSEIFGAFSEKIHPLGFNYHVFCPGSPLIGTTSKIGFLKKRIKGVTCYVSDYEAKMTHVSARPRILFITRLWDPAEPVVQTDSELVRQWGEINEMRMLLVRKLRAAFPEQFIGGIQDSPFARTQCPDLILSEHSTWKRIYLHRMKHSEICIASTGLHQSSGWKIAEYLAAGRAIVSEPLCYEVPGPFQAGENYLTYTSADGCIEQIRTLLAHPEQILQMGQRNRAYYDTWLRPDQIVTKALEQAKILL